MMLIPKTPVLCVMRTFSLFTFALTSLGVGAIPSDPELNYEILYRQGVSSYLENNWVLCVSNMENAIEDYNWWKKSLASCRKQCHKEASQAELVTVEEYKFYEKLVHNTLCLVKCKKNVFGNRMDHVANKNVDHDFELRKVYDYLQLCYFQLGELQKAANAATTVLAAQPDHEVMKTNLEFYLADKGVVEGDIVDLEQQDYVTEYLIGNKEYFEEHYEQAIEHMEKSLELYWEEDLDCRMMCEAPFDMGWFPDFVSSVANHFTSTLRCKNHCEQKLANVVGKVREDFLPSYFNYLQYSYFKAGDLLKACEAVASYLTLIPEDEVQIGNKEFFLEQENVKEGYFVPRKEVVEYKKRRNSEETLIDFIEKSFLFIISTDSDKTDESLLEKRQMGDAAVINFTLPSSHSLDLNHAQSPSAIKEELSRQYWPVPQMEVKVVMEAEELQGTKRVVADGFASIEECEILSKLAKLAAVEGDGYETSISPHSKNEHFQGLTIGRAALLAHAHLIKPEILELMLDISADGRDYVEDYFGLEAPLYFSFTHLVCRIAKLEGMTNITKRELSHDVHGDNCILQKTGECLKIPPAYTFRDYSAILYLNDDFEGGEFIFTQDASGETYESKVLPKCGRLVGFSAGAENPHGVLPVLRGRRCALGMWFTHDKQHEENERQLARQLLQKLYSEEGL
ncbi:prolyl 3-hydroxylase 1-like [Oratosquilla oratoria]|uniref:prolyl 3-hydroxylase 1-like n=1 Tax=Oratosquilla oratoria TaxID=337810 RepID=UPI003F774FFA